MPDKFSSNLMLNKWIDGPYRLSHHPLCSPFTGHTLKVFNKDVCRGCLFWYPGILFGILFSFVIQIYSYKDLEIAFILSFLIIPTLLQLILPIDRKIKDLARFLLGTATGFSIIIVLMPGSPPWYVKLIIIAVFTFFILTLSVVRNSRNEETCIDCSEYPLRVSSQCTGYKILLQRQIIVDTQIKIGISDVNESDVNITNFDDI